MFDKEEIISLLQELIRRPSRNPPGEEKECAEFIASYLADHRIETEIIDAPYPGRPQVVAWVRGRRGSPTLVLNGHTDVVPEGDPSAWTVPPFSGIYRDGKVYGRGAADMKGGLTAMIFTARALASIPRLEGTLMLQFVMGEETGEPGTRYLLSELGLTGDWGVVLEGTELQVSTAQNGLIWYRISVEGRQAHASRPEDGVNAISKAADLVRILEQYGHEISSRKHALGNKATAVPTMINGGVKENVIPDRCSLVLDRRILPGETVAAVDAEIQAIVDRMARKHPDSGYSLEKLKTYESAEISDDNPLVQMLHKYSREIAGIPDIFWGESGATDARNFVNDAKTPAVVWGPGAHTGAHIVDECIDVGEIIKAIQILEKTARHLLE